MDKPAAVITGPAAWASVVTADLERGGLRVVRCAERAGYVPRLTHDRAALILVDGADPGWAFWATAPKASPATRRVTVVFVADDDRQFEAAARAGADVCLRTRDLPERIGAVIAGCLPGEEARRRLLDACSQPLPDLARRGIEQLNHGAYYRQHDSLEELWMQETGPARDLYQAILQVGLAYHQVTQGNRRGALKMALRALRGLGALPDVCQGVDVARLRADALALRDALTAFPDGDMRAFDRTLLRPVRLVDDDRGE
jgi:hypothetical protein